MTEPIFVFKVALDGDSDIWRRIALRGDQTLNDLHWAIFDAFDRDDEHLYSFYFPKPGSRSRGYAAVRNAEEYSCPEVMEETFDDKPVGDAAETRLSSLNLRASRKFKYLFDFGDEWWHEVQAEQIKGIDDGGKYPRILEEHGKSPAQYPNVDEE